MRFVPRRFSSSAWELLVIGLARPHVERMLLREKATVILVVDTSRSMQAKDVEPTRLGAAQEALRSFIDDAPDDLRIGLVVLRGGAGRDAADERPRARGGGDHGHRRVPRVRRHRDRRRSPDRRSARPAGDRPRPEDEGHRRARAVHSDTIARTGHRARGGRGEELGVDLFLSDGAQTRGVLQPSRAPSWRRTRAFPSTRSLSELRGGVIERGPFGGVPQDSGRSSRFHRPDTLRAIARVTGGEFFEARTADALSKTYDNLGSRLGRESGESEITWLFLAIAAVLLLLAGATAAFVSPRFPSPTPPRS